jgi:uncharacterized protein DUF885
MSGWLSSAPHGSAVTVHEVMPGHFAHGRMIRQIARGDVRRSLFSEAFVEGWAHYAGELMAEQGFRAGDPRFAIGAYLDALVAVTGLAAALGVHRGTMTVDDATARFEADAFLRGPAARGEALRAIYDPTYGRYTGASCRSCRCGTRPWPPGARGSRSGASTQPSSASGRPRSHDARCLGAEPSP